MSAFSVISPPMTVTGLWIMVVSVAVNSRIMADEFWPSDRTNTGPLIAVAGTTAVKKVRVTVTGTTSIGPVAAVNTTLLLDAGYLKPPPFRVIVEPRAARTGDNELRATGSTGLGGVYVTPATSLFAATLERICALLLPNSSIP